MLVLVPDHCLLLSQDAIVEGLCPPVKQYDDRNLSKWRTKHKGVNIYLTVIHSTGHQTSFFELSFCDFDKTQQFDRAYPEIWSAVNKSPKLIYDGYGRLTSENHRVLFKKARHRDRNTNFRRRYQTREIWDKSVSLDRQAILRIM